MMKRHIKLSYSIQVYDTAWKEGYSIDDGCQFNSLYNILPNEVEIRKH